MSTTDKIESTYDIGLKLGFDDGKGSSGIDDNTFYIIIGIICCFCIISSVFVVIGVVASKSSGPNPGISENADMVTAMANQSKLPISINITTSPQYYPK